MQAILYMKIVWVNIMNEFSKIVSDFFIKYLTLQKGSSENTLKTYRDAFIQLLEFMKSKGKTVNKIKISDFNYDLIIEFLNWLEESKKISISTRNNRLAAIKSFFRYVSYHKPEYLNICIPILEIRKKKTTNKPMNYLTIDAFEYLVQSFNKSDTSDLRDLAIILLLYESGARVSELINIKLSDIQLSKPSTITLYGKGKKIRIVPLDPTVVNLIKKYVQIYGVKNDGYLFFNSKKEKLTREGINYIIQKHFIKVKKENKTMFPSSISPHSFRHSKAMHLLENGVNLIYIRDILGHSSVTTTEIYSKANPEIKRKHLLEASKQLNINNIYNEDDKNLLLEWLKNSI